MGLGPKTSFYLLIRQLSMFLLDILAERLEADYTGVGHHTVRHVWTILNHSFETFLSEWGKKKSKPFCNSAVLEHELSYHSLKRALKGKRALVGTDETRHRHAD